MTDLLGDGEARVYFLPHLRDPAAPTPAELAAGTELTDFTSGLALDSDDGAMPEPVLMQSTQTITFTVRADTRQFVRKLRRLRYKFRRLERALRRGDPKLATMHADYARRRRARRRRR